MIKPKTKNFFKGFSLGLLYYFAIIAFGGVVAVYASVLLSNTIGSFTTNTGGGTGSQYTIQTFDIGDSTFDINSVTFLNSGSSPSNSMDWAIFDSTGAVVQAKTTSFTTTGGATSTITWDSPATVTGLFAFGWNYNSGTGVSLAGIDGNVYTGGCLDRFYTAGTSISSFTDCTSGGEFEDDRDIYFILEGEDSTLTDTITFTSPTDSQSLVSDFDYFTFDYTLGEVATSSRYVYSIDLNYKDVTAGTEFYQFSDLGSLETSGEITVYKNYSLSPSQYNATSTFYYIDTENCPTSSCTYFYDYASTTLATDSVSFTISSFGGGGIVTPPTATTTVPSLTITCDPNSGFFGESFCKLGLSLFVPTSTSFSQFDSVKDLLDKKPPLGYFYAVKNALVDYSSTTLATPEFSLGEVENFEIIGDFKTGMTWFLWLVFGFWLIHRIRKFDFHT